MPFAALWFRREAAHRIVLNNSRLLAKQSDAGALLTCACSRQFQAFRKSSWAACWLGHARQHLDNTLQEAMPPSSVPGLGGRWLEDGNVCPSCGSTLAGWVCGGGDDHLTSCEEALVFQGRWHEHFARWRRPTAGGRAALLLPCCRGFQAKPHGVRHRRRGAPDTTTFACSRQSCFIAAETSPDFPRQVAEAPADAFAWQQLAVHY